MEIALSHILNAPIRILPVEAIKQRIIMSSMGFLRLVNGYQMEICLSIVLEYIAINAHGTKSICSDGKEKILPIAFSSDELTNNNLLKWNYKDIGIILSAFYWGFLISNIPGGLLADKYGCKWLLGFSILSTTILTLLTPIVIKTGGAKALIIVRILIGIGEGLVMPGLTVLLSTWVPPRERSRIGAFVYSGGVMGAIFGSVFTGILIDYLGTWEPVFYFWGIISIGWFIIWVLLCFNDPASHPFISENEKAYLLKHIGSLERDRNRPPTPWKAIFTSLPVLALIAAKIGHDWGLNTMAANLPQYMSNILFMSIKIVGIYTALPYGLMWICSMLAGFLSDFLINGNHMTVTNVRKMWTIAASIGPGIFIFSISYSACDKVVVVSSFTIGMGLIGVWYAGMELTVLDLTSNYSGTLMSMSISTMFGSITGIVMPILIGYVTPNALLNEWGFVFWTTFYIFAATSILILLYASGDIQPWNSNKPLTIPEISWIERETTKDEKSVVSINLKE